MARTTTKPSRARKAAPTPEVTEPPAGIGDNKPPLTPEDGWDYWKAVIDDLFMEAQNWLDGDPIANEQQAESLGTLLRQIGNAKKQADEARAAEKKPHWDAGKAVDEKFKPLALKCEQADRAARNALRPWLEMVEAENRRKAREAEEAARQAAREAEEARRREHQSDVLDDRLVEDREAAIQRAADAERAAREAAKAPTRVGTGVGRAVTLRTVRTAVIIDRKELLKHYMLTRPADLEEWLLEQAQKDVRAGAKSLPGVHIREDRVV